MANDLDGQRTVASDIEYTTDWLVGGTSFHLELLSHLGQGKDDRGDRKQGIRTEKKFTPAL